MSAPNVILCGSLTLDNLVTAEGRALPQSCGGNVVYAALGARLWRVRAGLVSHAGCVFPAAVMAALPAYERPRFIDYTTRGPRHRFATWLGFAPDGGDIPPP